MLNSIPIVVSSCCSHVARFWHMGAGPSEYLVWIIEAIICPDWKEIVLGFMANIQTFISCTLGPLWLMAQFNGKCVLSNNVDALTFCFCWLCRDINSNCAAFWCNSVTVESFCICCSIEGYSILFLIICTGWSGQCWLLFSANSLILSLMAGTEEFVADLSAQGISFLKWLKCMSWI